MKRIVILLAICSIGVGLYFGLIHKPLVRQTGDQVRILPGITASFKGNEDAGKYYGPMLKSFARRYSGEERPNTLTKAERRWFMLGTSCRDCDLYPGQFPHGTPESPTTEIRAARDLAVAVSRHALRLGREGRKKRALDILTKIAVLGWHVERENECLLSNVVGVAIQRIAYDSLAQLYDFHGDDEKAREYRRFYDDESRSYKHIARALSPPESWSDLERLKKIATTHSNSMWRKEACYSLAALFVITNPQARTQALEVLRTVSRSDSDPGVRAWADFAIPYVDGRKKLPSWARGYPKR